MAEMHIEASAATHVGAIVERLSRTELCRRSGLHVDDIRALVEKSATQAGQSAFVSGEGSVMTGHLYVEPSVSPAWNGTWWTQVHGWSADTGAQLRRLWATAAQPTFDSGARDFYSVVPADHVLLPDWFSLSFGIQHVIASLADEQVHRLQANGSGLAKMGSDAASSGAGIDMGLARPDDAGALARLEHLLPAALSEAPVFSPVEPQPLAESEGEWRETIADDSYITIVARAGADIIGFALACPAEKSTLHSGLLRVPNAVTLAQVNVLPHLRGCGWGKRLAAHAIREGLSRGFNKVVTDWRSTNLAADLAWRSMGFVPTAYRLQRVVGAHG